MDCWSKRIYGTVQVLRRYIYPIDVTSNRRYLIEDVQILGGECDIPYQSVLIDDVLPGVEVVVLDDVIIEDPVDDYDYDYEFD
jgi:hypothetical protein